MSVTCVPGAVLKLDPNHSGAFLNRILLERQYGESPVEDVEELIGMFTKRIRNDPVSAPLYSGRGHAYSLKDDLENAIVDYTEAIRLQDRSASAPLYVNRGTAYWRKGDLQRAIDDYTEAMQLVDDTEAELIYRKFICAADVRRKEWIVTTRDYFAWLGFSTGMLCLAASPKTHSQDALPRVEWEKTFGGRKDDHVENTG